MVQTYRTWVEVVDSGGGHFESVNCDDGQSYEQQYKQEEGR